MKILELMGHVEFQRLINQVKEARPEIPQWDGRTDNTDEWKWLSAMQAGYDLCVTKFGIDIDVVKPK